MRRGGINWLLVAGLALFSIVALAALLAPLIAPNEPNEIDLNAVLVSPGSAHWAGTDGIGRDLLTRIIYGGRVSLLVGGVGMLGSVVVGVSAGLVAAFGGRVAEWTVLRLIDVQLAFPYVLLAIAITSIVRPSVPVLILLMVLAGWAGMARVVRSIALQERAKDYVSAATLVGASRPRIALKYVFPTVLPAVLVLAPMQMAAMIVFESTLSFLGMGVQPPTPTWGGIMLEGRDYLSSAWWITTLPGLTIFVTSLSLILIAEGIQKRLGLTGERRIGAPTDGVSAFEAEGAAPLEVGKDAETVALGPTR